MHTKTNGPSFLSAWLRVYLTARYLEYWMKAVVSATSFFYAAEQFGKDKTARHDKARCHRRCYPSDFVIPRHLKNDNSVQ